MSHRCRDCRKKSEQIDSRWDRIRLWFFNIFTDDITDLSSDKFTQGYGEGYKAGFDRAKEVAIPSVMCDHPKQEFPIVNQEDVLTVSKRGKIFLKGMPVSDSEAAQLKTEAIMFQKSRLWQVMQETIKEQASRVMFENSQNFDDMKTGKLMLRNLDVQRKIVEAILPPDPPKA